MPCGIADIIKVIMLAPGADGFLCRCGAGIGALFLAGEDILELHHAGIGEHQRRIIARHQRAAFHHLMAIATEVIQEGRTDIIAAGHVTPIGSAFSRACCVHMGSRNPLQISVFRASSRVQMTLSERDLL